MEPRTMMMQKNKMKKLFRSKVKMKIKIWTLIDHIFELDFNGDDNSNRDFINPT
jgi:hypothetical protein